jgi:hypothetical protein
MRLEFATTILIAAGVAALCWFTVVVPINNTIDALVRACQ